MVLAIELMYLCLQAYEFFAFEVLGSVLVAVWSPFINLSKPPKLLELKSLEDHLRVQEKLSRGDELMAEP